VKNHIGPNRARCPGKKRSSEKEIGHENFSASTAQICARARKFLLHCRFCQHDPPAVNDSVCGMTNRCIDPFDSSSGDQQEPDESSALYDMFHGQPTPPSVLRVLRASGNPVKMAMAEELANKSICVASTCESGQVGLFAAGAVIDVFESKDDLLAAGVRPRVAHVPGDGLDGTSRQAPNPAERNASHGATSLHAAMDVSVGKDEKDQTTSAPGSSMDTSVDKEKARAHFPFSQVLAFAVVSVLSLRFFFCVSRQQRNRPQDQKRTEHLRSRNPRTMANVRSRVFSSFNVCRLR
jgi:hypothetical protein